MNNGWIVDVEPSTNYIEKEAVRSDARASTVYANRHMNKLQKLECSVNCVYNVCGHPWPEPASTGANAP
jgi:hypothetical protein